MLLGSKEVNQNSTAYVIAEIGVNHEGNIETAKIIGKVIAERAGKKNITEVAFDRSGYNYHGRVKALAESARENGLKF